MSKKPNAQYNLAKPDSLAVHAATRVRRKMFEMFMSRFNPSKSDEILDIGSNVRSELSVFKLF